MKSMKAVAAIVAAAGLTTGLAACGGSSSDNAANDTNKTVSITVWHGQNQSAAKVFNQLVGRFNATHPRIHVNSEVGAPSDALLQKVTTALAGGKYPDMAYIFGSNAANLARSPRVLDLTDVVKQPGWNWSDFYQAARETVTIDGKVRAVPSDIDALAVVYNKRLFKDAGVPLPRAPWTWDDFVATAKKLTNSSKGTFGTGWPATGDEDTVWRIWPMVWSAGGDVLSSDGRSVGYQGASGLKALTTAQQLQQDRSVYLDKTTGSEQMYRVFNNNRMAMVPTGPWELPDINSAKVDYGVVPMPTYGGQQVTISGPDTWMLFNNGKAKSAAVETFAQWLTQPEQDAVWDIDAGSLPLRHSSAEQQVWKDHAAKVVGVQDFVDQLDTARVRPTVEAYPKLSEAFGQAITGVLLGQKQPQDALNDAVAGGNRALSGS
ncbi:ABC transporter substrate-binding protein [Conexibacter woesei]|uniref:ABC transporter substrate-binding protein n=1 Tax=Conexibacter woesei TaxID=191495 RepID=UPI000417C7FB|nr:ABC transporter substrate-binding protein [Conexibacter woesei]